MKRKTLRNKNIVKLRLAGWSFRRIAKKYGVNHNAIYEVWKRHDPSVDPQYFKTRKRRTKH